MGCKGVFITRTCYPDGSGRTKIMGCLKQYFCLQIGNNLSLEMLFLIVVDPRSSIVASVLDCCLSGVNRDWTVYVNSHAQTSAHA